MAVFTQDALQNMMLGQPGWDIIQSGQTKYGSWFAARLVAAQGVLINDISLDILDQQWNNGQYFYGSIEKITNGSDYAILAYRTGNKQTYA